MDDCANTFQRSSSPLKRPASDMEPEQDAADVDMVTLPAESQQAGPEGEKAARRKKTSLGATAEESTSLEMKAGNALPKKLPPIAEQIQEIEKLVKANDQKMLQEGDEVYLVSRRWLMRAQGLDPKHASKEAVDGVSIGPVDNSDIIHTIFTDALGKDSVKLKPGTGIEHFELFPKEAWDLVVSWYGLAADQIPIVRIAHNTSPDSVSLDNIQYEFHPPVFIIHRLWSHVSPIAIESRIKMENQPPPVLVQSTSHSFVSFLRDIKRLTGVDANHKIRLWRLLQTLPATEKPAATGMKTPPDSPDSVPGVPESTVSLGTPIPEGSWPELSVDIETFLKLEKGVERDLIDSDDQSTNPNYNGRKSLALAGLTVDTVLVVDEKVGDAYVSLASSAVKDNPVSKKGSSGSLASQVRNNGSGSGRASPSSLGPVTRGRAQRSGRTIGCVGLQNLGNTCYMNSALQCVRSVEELTKYFLTHEAQKEINPNNPLSHNGDVASAYGKLLEDIYKDPPPASIPPRQFKNVIGRYAPAFSGYGQQDSQEFLGFLLDGLQEDLSRVKKKPYIAKPDSTDDMINNPNAIREMADKVWDITKKRDDSVIADLFTGMYKSTLVCPVCHKISITFDPFNNLTLPLPVANMWTRVVRYYPLNDAPVDITCDVEKNTTIRGLKQYLSPRVGVPAERIYGAEEFKDKFFKFYDEDKGVTEEITSHDRVNFYELESAPTNITAPKKSKIKSMVDLDEDDGAPLHFHDPAAERMLVPVVHRLHPLEASQLKESEAPPPHFILLTPEEARSEDMIRRKVLEKVATYTTWAPLHVEDETDTESSTDTELVNTASDADSGGDSKVIAKSIEDEDDIVDVTMTDASAGSKIRALKSKAMNGSNSNQFKPLRKFKSRRPKWLDPREYLSPECQNLFTLTYFRDQSPQPMSVGWNTVKESVTFPALSTRLRKPAASDVEMKSPDGAWTIASDDSLGDEGPEDASMQSAVSVTRMVDDSSASDSDLGRPQQLQPRARNGLSQGSITRGGKKKMKPGRTYGRKGMKRFSHQQRERERERERGRQRSAVEVADVAEGQEMDEGGPLVRLGEGLIVEWYEQAFLTVFDGQQPDQGAGLKKYLDVSELKDTELEAKQEKRKRQKEHGIYLDDCLAEFEREEVLSENDTWYCPRCKEHRRATKKFDLWKTPDILCVHLKRFSSSGWRRDKLDVRVDFPIEGLDLTQRVINQEDGREEIFDLIAIDDHWGGLGGGHYTAHSRNFIDGEWYEYNDNSVSKVKDLERMVSSSAYLLFYRRRSEKPLGGPRFQEISERFNGQFSDDTAAGLEESRRLGQGSSHFGSPSALTGAGPLHHQENRGSGSTSQNSNTASSSTIHVDPDPVAGRDANDDGTSEHSIDFTFQSLEEAPSYRQSKICQSVEADDEGIDLPSYSIGAENWNFDNIHLLGGDDMVRADGDNDGDLDSIVAQNDDSSVDSVFAEHDELRESYTEQTDEAMLPTPTWDEHPHFHDLRTETWDSKVHNVPPDLGLDEASDKVAEIHVGEDND